MDSNIQMSTRFLTAQNAHQVRMLVSLMGDAPPRRPPINVALVLDRSGSMTGEPIEAAKEAAKRFTRFLGPNDRLTVVVFDDVVETIYGPAPAGSPEVEHVIDGIDTGGTTNLSGGWLKGREHVASGLVEGTNRVVLFTDGCANQGITSIGKLSKLARGARKDRVTTTCIGFSSYFNEDLLKSMSDAGGANFWYIEEVDQMGGIFDEEIAGLVALAAQNVEITVRLDDPRVAGITFVQELPQRRTDDGAYVVTIGDLYATSPRELGLVFHVEDVQDLGEVKLGVVRVVSDALVEAGIEHRTVTMPVVANLDGQDHIEADVETTLVRFEAAQARKEAVRRADDGDYEGAAAVLRSAVKGFRGLPSTPLLDDEREDLEAEAERLGRGLYESADRKYHIARSLGSTRGHDGFLEKISRRKRGKK
jgi:Ca-activated chloride channel family protein